MRDMFLNRLALFAGEGPPRDGESLELMRLEVCTGRSVEVVKLKVRYLLDLLESLDVSHGRLVAGKDFRQGLIDLVHPSPKLRLRRRKVTPVSAT